MSPNAGGRGEVAGFQQMSTAVQYTGAQINFGSNPIFNLCSVSSSMYTLTERGWGEGLLGVLLDTLNV
jgi:hypothetical protein